MKVLKMNRYVSVNTGFPLKYVKKGSSYWPLGNDDDPRQWQEADISNIATEHDYIVYCRVIAKDKSGIPQRNL